MLFKMEVDEVKCEEIAPQRHVLSFCHENETRDKFISERNEKDTEKTRERAREKY